MIAPDLSGHGNSGTRTGYDLETWATEVMEILPAAGVSGRPTIVGHSMGGWVAATAAILSGDEINSVVVIDSPLRDRAPEAERLRNRKRKEYGSREEILARFAPVPPQELVLPYVAKHIAAESIRKAGKKLGLEIRPDNFRR